MPPYPPYDPTDKHGFSYETVVKRWPVIITGVIDQLHNACHALSSQAQALGPRSEEDDKTSSSLGLDPDTKAKIGEGQSVIARISKLKYDMGRDHPLDEIAEDGEAHASVYNEELAKLEKEGRGTWFTAPWLFAECYLYRLLRSFLNQTEHWKSHDPFVAQKVQTFRQSGASILQIANTIHELEVDKDLLRSDPEKLRVLFTEMIQMCLWGNATDLSLLTHMTASDIAQLQSVGREAQDKRREFILRDDQKAVWDHMCALDAGRVDFVLDNSGFELFTDLVFADFLVTYTPYVAKVVFHPKLIPWFVSDVTPPDFKQTFEYLLDASFFPELVGGEGVEQGGGASSEYLRLMVLRWKKYLDDGVFSLSVPVDTPIGASLDAADFWTAPYAYWNMETQAPGVFGLLKGSDLVVFKGDLNFRKLTGDIKWPAWTAFEAALGDLAGSFPLLSLRTNKADVVVGVDRDVAERLDQSGEKWRVDGRYALISFLPAKM